MSNLRRMRRGVCSVCGRPQGVRVDDTVKAHTVAGQPEQWCPGSGEAPRLSQGGDPHDDEH